MEKIAKHSRQLLTQLMTLFVLINLPGIFGNFFVMHTVRGASWSSNAFWKFRKLSRS